MVVWQVKNIFSLMACAVHRKGDEYTGFVMTMP